LVSAIINFLTFLVSKSKVEKFNQIEKKRRHLTID